VNNKVYGLKGCDSDFEIIFSQTLNFATNETTTMH